MQNHELYELILARNKAHETWQDARLAGVDRIDEDKLRDEWEQLDKRVKSAASSLHGS